MIEEKQEGNREWNETQRQFRGNFRRQIIWIK